jgi:hypothetical protein
MNFSIGNNNNNKHAKYEEVENNCIYSNNSRSLQKVNLLFRQLCRIYNNSTRAALKLKLRMINRIERLCKEVGFVNF